MQKMAYNQNTNRIYNNIPLGVFIRGQVGKTHIFRKQVGNGYYGSIPNKIYQNKYPYFVPTSINNPQGQNSRIKLTAAVLHWQNNLTEDEKEEYRKKAQKYQGLTGYNLFIKMYMLGDIP